MGDCAGTGYARLHGCGEAPGEDKGHSRLSDAFPYLQRFGGRPAPAYLDGHEAGSRYAWKRSGKAGEPPGWEADEEEAERNADPAIDGALQKWTGDCEGSDARFEGKLEEIERELVREALTAWSGFADFCAKELGLEAEKLLEALAGPFAERVPELEELSARYEVEPEGKGVEEYTSIMTEAWHSVSESA